MASPAHLQIAAPGPVGPAAQHFAPPSARELRVQAVQRLQVGLFGVCAMLLMVGLANIIMDHARLAEIQNPPTAPASPGAKPASDPLADIGVVPAADPSRSASSGAPR